MAKELQGFYTFTPGGGGAGTIVVNGFYRLEQFQLITNITDQEIIFNFADTGKGATLSYNATTDKTTLTLETNTSSMSSTDRLQIFVQNLQGQEILPSGTYQDPVEKLRVSNPSPFMFFFNFNDFQIIGASPEILVRLRDNKITVRPIAGTRPRGKTHKEDQFYKKDLLKDKKELAEHLMLLDLGRNDAGKVSKINSVKVTESFIIEKYSHVMHIVSNVIGEHDKRFSKFKSLLAGFPAGTVSGAPKIRAMEIIDELETTKRKVYAGGIGYFSANGEFDTCIALRTAVAKKNKFYVQAGAGIVADSKPLKEYEETVNKAKALINALK